MPESVQERGKALRHFLVLEPLLLGFPVQHLKLQQSKQMSHSEKTDWGKASELCKLCPRDIVSREGIAVQASCKLDQCVAYYSYRTKCRDSVCWCDSAWNPNIIYSGKIIHPKGKRHVCLFSPSERIAHLLSLYITSWWELHWLPIYSPFDGSCIDYPYSFQCPIQSTGFDI